MSRQMRVVVMKFSRRCAMRRYVALTPDAQRTSLHTLLSKVTSPAAAPPTTRSGVFCIRRRACALPPRRVCAMPPRACQLLMLPAAVYASRSMSDAPDVRARAPTSAGAIQCCHSPPFIKPARPPCASFCRRRCFDTRGANDTQVPPRPLRCRRFCSASAARLLARRAIAAAATEMPMPFSMFCL